MNDEIWKDVPDWEGVYQVSDLGRIKSLARQKRNRFEGDRIMKPRVTPYGYLYVALSSGGKKKYMFVHRLVAIAFTPNPGNREYVDHKDNNRVNARLDNLQWVTPAENNQFAVDRGRPPSRSMLGRSGDRHNKSKKVKCSTLGIVFGSAHEAARKLGMHQSSISKVCRGEITHKEGLVFNYIIM